MSRLTRDQEQVIEDRVLEYVRARPYPIGIVDSKTVAVACRLSWRTAKSVLLELALERKISAQRLSGRWYFAGLPDA